VFKDILTATEEDLVQRFYKFRDEVTSMGNRLQTIAKRLGLRPEQLALGLGFNPNARFLTEVLPILGYATFEELSKERNEIFINDIYKRVSLDDVLGIYAIVKDDPGMQQVMQYLLKQRLERIEQRIEETVNSIIIDKYKAEMRAIYSDGIATIEFADERLNRTDSGFRSLLNEVGIIVDSRLIPAGDIFFRDTILPEEKRKILAKGLIPMELVQARLEDENTSTEERQVLLEFLKTHRS
jgi:hypothetical protein